MNTPSLNCINKEERMNGGFNSFKEWVESPNHVYIGGNVRKYLRDYSKKDSFWCNPFASFDLNKEDANKYYESFVRSNPHLIERIGELGEKTLGCWCTENCHGQVLIKLYREYEEGLKTPYPKRDFIESEKSSHPSKKIKFDHFSRNYGTKKSESISQI